MGNVTALSGSLPADAVEPETFRRLLKSRRVFRKDGVGSARDVIGELEPGVELCGMTNGQFSLVDIVEHCLQQTGPADVCIATWTMGIYDADKAWSFVRNKLIRRVRFILDPSMFSRRPELSAVLVKGFGVDAFRAVNSHAKFCTIRGPRLAVACRSSMNLNENRRLETFDLSCDDTLTAFYESLVDKIWRKIDEGNRSQSARIFEDLLEVNAVKSSKRLNPFLAAQA